MEVINEILIHMNILLMTSDVFLHWKKHFQIISNGNFLYFYFCKGWDACRFFLHNQRNTNICICMAFREQRLGLTQYLSVHKLCKKKKKKDACNTKSWLWKTSEAKVHQYLTVLTRKKFPVICLIVFCIKRESKF